MRLRFFWTGLRTDVTAWVKCCSHCLSYNVWRNWKQELHFYWPVTIPFYIMHVNLWAPGTSLSNNSSFHHLLNAMCDLMRFVVSTITTETHAEHIAKLYMDNVVIVFVMVAIIVFGASIRFKSVFKDMCTALVITHCPLARGNHKGMSVENIISFSTKLRQLQAKTYLCMTSLSRM